MFFLCKCRISTFWLGMWIYYMITNIYHIICYIYIHDIIWYMIYDMIYSSIIYIYVCIIFIYSLHIRCIYIYRYALICTHQLAMPALPRCHHRFGPLCGLDHTSSGGTGIWSVFILLMVFQYGQVGLWMNSYGLVWILDQYGYGLIWIDMDWYEIGSYEDILVIMGNGVVNSKCPNFAHDLSLPDGTALPVMRSDCTGTKIGLCFFWILAPLAAERTWSP
jgi:hypothetical protein